MFNKDFFYLLLFYLINYRTIQFLSRFHLAIFFQSVIIKVCRVTTTQLFILRGGKPKMLGAAALGRVYLHFQTLSSTHPAEQLNAVVKDIFMEVVKE